MVNYFIYAKDFSYSTNGVNYYHTNGLKTVDQFKNDVKKINEELLIAGEPSTESKIIYLHWGHECWEVDEETTITTYNELVGGRQSTNPDVIIKWLEENNVCDNNSKIQLLYIITDGMVDRLSVQNCFESNKNKHYETFVFHAFNSCLEQIDLSVASSFFKSRCMVYRNNKLFDSTDICKQFDYDKVDINNFAAEKNQLKSYIKLKFINKCNHDFNALQEIDKLKKLRDQLFHELSLKTVNRNNNTVYLETKDRNLFLREFVNTDWYKNLSTAIYEDKVDIEKSISAMINYIMNDAKSYSFDALKFDTKYDKSVQEESMVDVKFTPEQEIEFPDVILDDDKGIPVVILSKLNLMDKIIFHGQRESRDQVSLASFNKFKSAMECPLFLVNDQDMSESIGYFYTLNVYKQLLANNTNTDPRTRRPFHGGLVLTDTNQFDKYNDYILSGTYFNCKKVNYNIGLFYFVLWKNCENKEWMDRNVVEQFKKYVMRRISETTCKIGLSSLPLDPQENAPLLTALWYCVELSSCIFKNDPENFKHERLRGFHGVAHHMIEILKYFNYDLDVESIEKRRELVSQVMTLKRIDKRRDKVYYLLENIFNTVDGFLVSEIKSPFNLYKLNYLKFHHKEMLRDDVVEEKVHLNDYVHLMYMQGDLEASKAGESTYEICEKTFRPFFALGQNKSFYTEFVNKTRKVVINNDNDKDKIEVTYEAIDSLEFDRVLSLYKLFIDFVKESTKYPTLPEYVKYVSRKKKFNTDLVTVFPSNVYFDAKNVYNRYQQVVEKIAVTEFIKVCKSNVMRPNRIKAEERVKFSSDNEIEEFIASEELKVKLVKKHS